MLIMSVRHTVLVKEPTVILIGFRHHTILYIHTHFNTFDYVMGGLILRIYEPCNEKACLRGY